MWAWISQFILGVLQAIPIFQKYFPPKSGEQKTEDDQTAIAQQIADEQSSGRPK